MTAPLRHNLWPSVTLAGLLAVGPPPRGGARATAVPEEASAAPPAASASARDLYNAGTRALTGRRWAAAESLLQAALAKQDDRLQPRTLYNLGAARFAAGAEELTQAPAASAAQAAAATRAGAAALETVQAALRETERQRLVDAYLRGRGAQRELRAARKAVARAMAVYGNTLARWRRALGDFEGAAELQPAAADAAQNAAALREAIARLVDSLREQQQQAGQMSAAAGALGEQMQQLRGKIPANALPPGAANGEDEEPEPGLLAGPSEPPVQSGQELDVRLAPDEASRLVDSLTGNGERLLPLGREGSNAPPLKVQKPW